MSSIDTTRPHTGSYSAYLAGYNNGTDTIYQQVTIPSTATSATLTYWWYMSTQEACSTPYDYLYAQVLNSSGAMLATLQTMTNASTKNTWTKSTYNLLAYKGQTIRVYFKAHERRQPAHDVLRGRCEPEHLPVIH